LVFELTSPQFYCSGIEACDEYGMVGVVNPNANTSLDTHRKKAEEMTYTLQPGTVSTVPPLFFEITNVL